MSDSVIRHDNLSVVGNLVRAKGVEKTFSVDCHSLEIMPKYKYFHHGDKVRDIGGDYLQLIAR